MRNLVPAIGCVWLMNACVSHKSISKTYHATGHHEIAVHYMAAASVQAEHSPQSRNQLAESIQYSLANMRKEYDDAKAAGDTLKAFSAAIRQQELMIWANRLKLSEFEPNTLNNLVEESRNAAIQTTQQNMDKAAAETDIRKEMEAVRQALGLDPNNPEFVSRYQRLKNAKLRRILIRNTCQASFKKHCHAALGQLTALLTDAKRETIVLSTADAKQEDAVLTINIKADESESPWTMYRSGNSTNKVPVKNEFNEIKKDKRGNAITKPVSAKWRVYESKSASLVTVKVDIKSLRSDKRLLFSEVKQDKKIDTRSYYEWTGDHRALGYEVTQHGQNQMPSEKASELSSQIRKKLISELAENIIHKLEY